MQKCFFVWRPSARISCRHNRLHNRQSRRHSRGVSQPLHMTAPQHCWGAGMAPTPQYCIYRYPHARNSTDLLLNPTFLAVKNAHCRSLCWSSLYVQSSMPYSSFSSRNVIHFHTLRSSHSSYRPNKSLRSTGGNIWQKGQSPR